MINFIISKICDINRYYKKILISKEINESFEYINIEIKEIKYIFKLFINNNNNNNLLFNYSIYD